MNRFSLSRLERHLPLILLSLTGLVLLPSIRWMVRETATHSQLLHGFLVFLLTLGLIFWHHKKDLPWHCQLGKNSLNALFLTYGLLLVAVLADLNFLILPALACACAALLYFLFGPAQHRLILSSVLCLLVFMSFVLLLPLLDWPLRSVAGNISARGLALLGQEIRLGLISGRQEPLLILLSGGRPFHVAPECNGFGMLLSSLLMTCMLVFHAARSLPLALVAIPLALLFGLLVNGLRIIIIVLLAPHVGDAQYVLMHEAVGLATTYGGLGLLYLGWIRLL
ncbi:MAG: hypothetical protein RL648_1814 [Verrucomicrobiota bacterium]|jgi:exosortase/archaeosortase family protein